MVQPTTRIDSVHAWIATESDGTEGIIGIRLETGWMPLVAYDETLARRLEHKARLAFSLSSAKSFRLVKFSNREVLIEG